jgi:cytochrome P450 family 9
LANIDDPVSVIAIMWWLVVAVALVLLGYYWLVVLPNKYWLEKGVNQERNMTIFGSSWKMIARKQCFAEMVQEVYNKFPNCRYSGIYQFFTATLVIRDPDLIKQIAVKDFDHFVDHRSFVTEDMDPLWGKNLFSLTGQRWREMRATLSPAFTSSKMKYMFSLISQSGEQFVNHFLKKNEDLITVEMKDTLTRFTNDVIANTAFGIECDSLGERKNEFYMMGKEATNLTGTWTTIKLFAFILIPKVCKILNVSLFSEKVGQFFSKLVKSNIESREKHRIVRPDMINLLMEARKNGLKHEESEPQQDAGFATVQESEIGKSTKSHKLELTDQDITSQALIFFFAGFETVSSLMCFMAYELGVNPDIQQRLIQEVDDTLEACNGKLTYEAVSGTKYMDMVLSEALRKWPNAVAADRVCTKSYTIEPKTPDEKPVHLEKNAVIWLPIMGLHRDPQYWPEPDRFDPERFSEENKMKINPYTFLPFGVGPRNCIGSRFALLETKTLFFYILAHFEIVPVEKTQIPLQLSRKTFAMTAEKGFWLGFKRRVKI